MSEHAPAVLDELIKNALQACASDIHIEPSLDSYTLRFRVDGFLLHHTSLDLALGNSLVTRIKVLAQVDIAERRLPQDGKFTSSFSEGLCDIRIATFPSLYGEKVVLRLLRRDQELLELEQLGLSSELYKKIGKIIQRTSGLFLATGPTGSGKTTLLHALLTRLRSVSTNIMTLEDPVEYTIQGITQTTINPALGLTFDSGLRSLLRLDPDVIMVGEMRDTATAQVAVRAALTGHLVVSTLHTVDAPSALMRLLEMGVQGFLLNATLCGIIAQRLLRKLCTECKERYTLSSHEKALSQSWGFSLEHAYKGRGCRACKETGTHGRIGIFQFLAPSSSLQKLIKKQVDYTDLTKQAYEEGMKPLMEDAVTKLHEGIIGFNELLRIDY